MFDTTIIKLVERLASLPEDSMGFLKVQLRDDEEIIMITRYQDLSSEIRSYNPDRRPEQTKWLKVFDDPRDLVEYARNFIQVNKQDFNNFLNLNYRDKMGIIMIGPERLR